MKDELRDWISARYPSDKSESPIEQLFHASLTLLWDTLMLPRGTGLKVEQQVPIGNYLADFLFTVVKKEGGKAKVVVELDGHDFHERTKEQASRDKARDRWMTANGIIVLRFTGSDVWRNPFQCAAECADRIHQVMYGVTRKEAAFRAGLEAIRRIVEEP